MINYSWCIHRELWFGVFIILLSLFFTILHLKEFWGNCFSFKIFPFSGHAGMLHQGAENILLLEIWFGYGLILFPHTVMQRLLFEIEFILMYQIQQGTEKWNMGWNMNNFHEIQNGRHWSCDQVISIYGEYFKSGLDYRSRALIWCTDCRFMSIFHNFTSITRF